QLTVSYGEGEVRATNEQNLVLRFVPDARLPALHRELVRVGLALKDANTVADVVSCPGASSCKIAVTASRGLGSQLTELLDRRPDLIAAARGVDIKVSGCPNGCGQHYIAGIGFQGGMRKVAGRPAATAPTSAAWSARCPRAARPPRSSACSTSTSAKAAPAMRSGPRSRSRSS